tara:strand:+ start:8194 stop:8604 length:411 start_codon:yes stop_codon:yes gene_type:complete
VREDTLKALTNVFATNQDFDQNEKIIQSCIDGIFNNNKDLEDKLFKRYRDVLLALEPLWCNNYDIMNYYIAKGGLRDETNNNEYVNELLENPWECRVCTRYARLIVVALEMSCNLSSRRDELKKGCLIKHKGEDHE